MLISGAFIVFGRKRIDASTRTNSSQNQINGARVAVVSAARQPGPSGT
jgi:hypothetical protein